jgi:hypothetical protein
MELLKGEEESFAGKTVTFVPISLIQLTSSSQGDSNKLRVQ